MLLRLLSPPMLMLHKVSSFSFLHTNYTQSDDTKKGCLLLMGIRFCGKEEAEKKNKQWFQFVRSSLCILSQIHSTTMKHYVGDKKAWTATVALS